VLPLPMLARAESTLPVGDYAFEVTWDGFRTVVSTEDGFRVRSRRGWRMEPLIPELPYARLRKLLESLELGGGFWFVRRTSPNGRFSFEEPHAHEVAFACLPGDPRCVLPSTVRNVGMHRTSSDDPADSPYPHDRQARA
jgi:hypothetical protein